MNLKRQRGQNLAIENWEQYREQSFGYTSRKYAPEVALNDINISKTELWNMIPFKIDC